MQHARRQCKGMMAPDYDSLHGGASTRPRDRCRSEWKSRNALQSVWRVLVAAGLREPRDHRGRGLAAVESVKGWT